MSIRRRAFLKSVAVTSASLMSPYDMWADMDAQPREDSNRPNILFIFADDLGYEMLGCYGGLGDLTPNLDRMASDGIRFARAYTSPVCTPSRMSVYTGTYVARHRYYDVLPVHRGTRKAVDFGRYKMYAQVLSEAGYQTSVTGKWQLATLEHHPDHCRSAGFDSWCVWQIWSKGGKTKRYWKPALNRDGELLESTESSFGPDILTDYVIERMIAAKKDGQPFCIHHNMMLPHTPIVQTPDDKKENRKESLANMVSYMDKQVGRILNAVDKLGLVKNTIVIFAGDNGTENGPKRTKAGTVLGGKRSLTDGGIHVPLIARCPGRVPKGAVLDDLVDSADIFATFCELAGVPVPSNAAPDGISFCDPLLGRGKGKRKWVTAGISRNFIVFDGNWRIDEKSRKLIDCRELPSEKAADMTSADAQAAKEQLEKIIDELSRLK